MATTDLNAPDTRARQESREARRRRMVTERAKRTESAAETLRLQEMNEKERAAEREVRRRQMPETRARRLAERTARPAPLREQVESLHQEIETLRAELAQNRKGR
jgi:hypothetical protein